MATEKIKDDEKRFEDEGFFGFDEDDGLDMPHMGPAMAITILISFLGAAALIIYGLIRLALWLK